jgi:hypothetical protein
MRGLLLTLTLAVVAFTPGSGNADPRSPQMDASSADKSAPAAPNYETYRGYVFDLSENAERQDSAALADELRRQLDVVESVGLSPQVLKFFRTVPIVAKEMACLEKLAGAACYGTVAPPRAGRAPREITVWDREKLQWSNPDIVDLAEDARSGVLMVRPAMMSHAQDPVVLHEMLHAYHARLMPNGFENEGVLTHYNLAKTKQLYPAESYVLTNQKEFFAVTASVFLSGKDSAHEPFTRAALKEKQPDYYKYLVGVFGFDPDAIPAATPVASAN